MKHAHTVLFEKLYADLTKGDFKSAFSLCDDKFTFQIMGKSKLAGKFDKSNFESGYLLKQKELSSGSIKTEIHDVLASDLHATILMTTKLTRQGQSMEYRTVHVWRIQGGKPVAGYEYPRDLYQYDAIWS